MCFLRESKGQGGRFMDLALFRDLIDQLSGVRDVHLQGLGEPLLHPAYFAMVSYAVARGLQVTTNSNMTVLDRAGAEACVRSGLSWMRISIDGATPETYESIRRGARLERVMRNIKLLQAAKEKLGSDTPRLFLVMVVMRRNIEELEAVIELAHRFSLEQVFVQHLCLDFSDTSNGEVVGPVRGFIEAESLLRVDPSLVERSFRKARCRAAELRMDLRLPSLDIHGGARTCDWPWRSLYIASDGSAQPCCVIARPEWMNFGNAATTGIRQIWQNEAYQGFRSQLASGNPPHICRTCSVYRGTF
jgi:radical SAM protein with 4Fe4S-binding SPASM domain